MMIHKDKIEKYNGSMDELVEDIGNLRYDALSDFLQNLAIKLQDDAHADNRRGRKKLSSALWVAGEQIELASLKIEEAWEISEPFMKEDKAPLIYDPAKNPSTGLQG